MTDVSDPKIVKRIAGLVATGALPATALGAIGDLFAPIGGWIVVGSVGLFAAIIAVYLIASLWGRDELTPAPWWYRLSHSDPELNWIWSGKSPFLAHGVHVVLIFSISCMVFATKSFASSGEGGVLAKNVTAISVAQEQLGLSQSILAEQKKTNSVLTSIDTKAENFKREISSDPRKELFNSGVLWEHGRLRQALRESDTKVASLFFQGGMRLSGSDVAIAFEQSTPAIHELLADNLQLFSTSDCIGVMSSISAAATSSAAPSAIKMVRALCSNDETRTQVRAGLENAQAYYSRQVAAYNKEQGERRSSSECFKHEMRDGGRAVVDEAAIFNPVSVYTYTLRQEMLLNISGAAMLGRTSDKLETVVRSYCNKQAAAKPNIDISDAQVLRWRALKSWIS